MANTKVHIQSEVTRCMPVNAIMRQPTHRSQPVYTINYLRSMCLTHFPLIRVVNFKENLFFYGG